jgi:hypothetical protein
VKAAFALAAPAVTTGPLGRKQYVATCVVIAILFNTSTSPAATKIALVVVVVVLLLQPEPPEKKPQLSASAQHDESASISSSVLRDASSKGISLTVTISASRT